MVSIFAYQHLSSCTLAARKSEPERQVCGHHIDVTEVRFSLNSDRRFPEVGDSAVEVGDPLLASRILNLGELQRLLVVRGAVQSTFAAVLGSKNPVRNVASVSSAKPNYPNHRLLIVRAKFTRGKIIEKSRIRGTGLPIGICALLAIRQGTIFITREASR
jgi:hypothetical protein